MTNKVFGIVIIVLGLVLFTRFFMSGAMLFLIIAGLLAAAAATGVMGRSGYLLAGIFLLMSFAGSALRLAFGAFAMLFRLAPILVVLVGVYLLVKAVRK